MPYEVPKKNWHTPGDRWFAMRQKGVEALLPGRMPPTKPSMNGDETKVPDYPIPIINCVCVRRCL
jgi:hypothetical protein